MILNSHSVPVKTILTGTVLAEAQMEISKSFKIIITYLSINVVGLEYRMSEMRCDDIDLRSALW